MIVTYSKMAPPSHPRNVCFSPESVANDFSSKACFEDEPLIVGTASDASTASTITRFDDEPLRVPLPCFEFLHGKQPTPAKEFKEEIVFATGLSSDDETGSKAENPDVCQFLEAENRRLDEENAFLRMQYKQLLQMAQQGYAPVTMPGYPAWQWAVNGPPGLAPANNPAAQQKNQNLQRKGKQLRYSMPQADADVEADCSRSGGSSDADAVQQEPRTSVMLRNLPNSYTRQLLMKLLDDEGFAGKYDFVYLPIDFKTRLSLAYAFINLVNAEEAKRFWKHFNGFTNWAVPSHKVATVNWSEFQGLSRHIERYRSSPVMHEGVPDEYKPVLLSGGHRIIFPEPAEKVRAPRCRVRSKAMKPGRVA